MTTGIQFVVRCKRNKVLPVYNPSMN